MKLRPELQPVEFDERLVERLAQLAGMLDGARAGEWEEWLNEFNSLAKTSIPYEHFQGIYGGEEHITWVRRVLCYQHTKSVPDVTREELIEIVDRAMSPDRYDDYEYYMAIFDKNVPRENASSLIYSPPDYEMATNTWGGGRLMGEYAPTAEQIVDWALQGNPQTE